MDALKKGKNTFVNREKEYCVSIDDENDLDTYQEDSP